MKQRRQLAPSHWVLESPACVCAQSCLTLYNHTAFQAPLSMEFFRQEYWRGLPFAPLGIFLTQGSNPHFLHLLHWQVDSFSLCHLGITLPQVTSGTQKGEWGDWGGGQRNTQMMRPLYTESSAFQAHISGGWAEVCCTLYILGARCHLLPQKQERSGWSGITLKVTRAAISRHHQQADMSLQTATLQSTLTAVNVLPISDKTRKPRVSTET